MAITRKGGSGIEITEARGEEDVFPCSLPLQEGTSRLERWRSHEGFPNATKAHLLLRAKPTKDNDPKDSPHLEEKLIGGDCRSRSPLLDPSRMSKNHGGNQ